jgi:transcriptional regulator with XRE-family HTH domain
MKLAERMRNIREAKGLTQAQIAYKVDITPQAYGKIERRATKTKYETLLKIAEAIGVSLHFLVDLNNCEYIEEKNNS